MPRISMPLLCMSLISAVCRVESGGKRTLARFKPFQSPGVQEFFGEITPNNKDDLFGYRKKSAFLESPKSFKSLEKVKLPSQPEEEIEQVACTRSQMLQFPFLENIFMVDFPTFV